MQVNTYLGMVWCHISVTESLVHKCCSLCRHLMERGQCKFLFSAAYLHHMWHYTANMESIECSLHQLTYKRKCQVVSVSQNYKTCTAKFLTSQINHPNQSSLCFPTRKVPDLSPLKSYMNVHNIFYCNKNYPVIHSIPLLSECLTYLDKVVCYIPWIQSLDHNKDCLHFVALDQCKFSCAPHFLHHR